MKPLKLVLTPTRNRRLNELVGLMVLVVAGLLLLALASYHSTDPSFNTVIGAAASRPENWIGIVGAYISDLLLQLEGAAAFCLPLLLAALGWTWMRSLPAGSPWAKAIGTLLTLLFVPAIFGLLPGHLHFLGGLPMEGLTGRLVVDALVRYLNFPGACIFTVAMVAVAVYLSTTFSFNTAKEWLSIRFAFVLAWRDRLANWKQARARAREQKKLAKADALREKELVKARKAEARQEKLTFKKKPEPVAEEAVPAHRQGGFAEMMPEPAPPQKSVWEQMPRATVPDPEPEPEPTPSIAVKERADAEIHKVTLAPKAHNGFRLPPSTLLHRSEDTQVVREDELRAEAQVLIEKCAEFDVNGQITQINPGPVVTTFEFRPEAGVKYSRVTGLADDLCLAMAAESILIERMAGKSTVGIQVPNQTRETIWLRDVVECENFRNAKSKLTLAMGKDINGRIVTADLATMPHVLIAGSTGSGKSVAINAMIMSLLFRTTP